MEFVPLYDRLLVQRCAEEKYQGLIEIPDSAKEKPMEGMVLAVGPGRYNDAGNIMPMSVKAGDRILMGKYAGTEIKIDGTDLLILREDEVLGLVKGERLPDKVSPEAFNERAVPIEGTLDNPLSWPEHKQVPGPTPAESAEARLEELRKLGGGEKP
jgi:chaperonin GroES